MTTRICSAVVLICLCTCVSARAALYEFTLHGQVTEVSFWPNVAVGDPFTIKYVADSTDLDPDALVGRYDASDAVVTLPNTTITSEGTSRVRVFQVTSAPEQRVLFESLIPNYGFDIDFALPAGTLTSDQLPLTLPVSSATSGVWQVYDFGPQVRGNVTSYASMEVPEPAAAASSLLLLMMAVAAGRRRRRLRCCC